MLAVEVFMKLGEGPLLMSKMAPLSVFAEHLFPKLTTFLCLVVLDLSFHVLSASAYQLMSTVSELAILVVSAVASFRPILAKFALKLNVKVIVSHASWDKVS